MATKILSNRKKVAISISESEEINVLGYSDTHVKDSMIEFARNLLIQGVNLVYGGDLRVGGFTETFADLAEQYRLGENDELPFQNYFSYPIYINLTKENLGDFKRKRVEIVKVEPDKSLTIEVQKYLKPDSIENKYIWAKCLTKMRREMNDGVAARDGISARVVVGGRNYGFTGKYPGIIEETRIALESNKPVYLIGAFGGATKKIIEAITKKKDVFDVNNSFYQNTENQKFIEHYNKESISDKIDYNEVNDYFKSLTVNDLNNNLNEKENEILFNTPHLPEMIFEVMKGIKRLN